MALKITNTLSGKKEVFTPLVPNQVKMYACGPTVYGLIHVGNARPLVFFNFVRNFLEYSGYQVTYVRNYTDVDDKIINKAREEKCSSKEIAERFTAEYMRDCELLGVKPPTHTPKVTEHIEEIIALTEKLIQNGTAYVTPEGEVLYSVRKFAEYGKLSKKKIDDLLAGARVAPGETKKDPLDFSLWKPQKAEDEPAWKSPWGMGRPGWHIECSAMAMKIFGEEMDIHGGGMDLIHPHHENEIAQSEAATHKPFARYWMHNNLISMGQEKMSKSLGNIFLNRDFVSKYGAEVLKYMILSAHYRSSIDFSSKQIQDCQAALHRIYSCLAKCEALQTPKAKTDETSAGSESLSMYGETFESYWKEYLDDDFNTPKVMALIFDYVRMINGIVDAKGFKNTITIQESLKNFTTQVKQLGKLMGLFQEPPRDYLIQSKLKIIAERGIDIADLKDILEERKRARISQNYKKSDEIREQLKAKGIELKDTPQGTEWDVV